MTTIHLEKAQILIVTKADYSLRVIKALTEKEITVFKTNSTMDRLVVHYPPDVNEHPVEHTICDASHVQAQLEAWKTWARKQ